MENRKQFMDQLSVTLEIKKPADWGKITVRQIHALGGNTLITHYYNGSLYSCLASIYKGFQMHCFTMFRYPME